MPVANSRGESASVSIAVSAIQQVTMPLVSNGEVARSQCQLVSPAVASSISYICLLTNLAVTNRAGDECSCN